MATQEMTLGKCVDEAIERLPFFRKRVVKRRMSNQRHRQAFMEELQVKLHDDERVQAMGLSTMLAQDTFDGDSSVFEIDIEKLEQFLKLIIEYLPKILEIILPLFMGISLMIAMLGMPSVASAQECKNGVCTLRPATAVVKPVVTSVAPAVKSVATIQSQVVRAGVQTCQKARRQRPVARMLSRIFRW